MITLVDPVSVPQRLSGKNRVIREVIRQDDWRESGEPSQVSQKIRIYIRRSGIAICGAVREIVRCAADRLENACIERIAVIVATCEQNEIRARNDHAVRRLYRVSAAAEIGQSMESDILRNMLTASAKRPTAVVDQAIPDV